MRVRTLTRPAPRCGVCARVCVCRLARKAESARQARLRHKQFVTDLQDQASGLQARINELEVHCTTGAGSAAVAIRELKAALTAEQQEQLRSWLVAAQGENHVLAKYENGAALPPPAAPLSVERMNGRGGGSAPVAIGGGSSAHWRGRNGAMESDDDTSLPLSRSWDDCEVARSILNLNSPNGFHPLAGNGTMPPPAAFELGGGTGGAPQSVSGFAGGSLLGGGRPPTASSSAAASIS